MRDLLVVFTLLDPTPTLQAVRDHYGRIASYYHAMKVIFERSQITLDIPADGKTTQDGWEIAPRSYPTVRAVSQNCWIQLKLYILLYRSLERMQTNLHLASGSLSVF